MSNHLLFVYGSMAEGMIHFQKLKDFIISTKPAKAMGTAYRLKIGFPAMVLAGQDSIHGNLVELKASEMLWHLLDEFYGYNSQEPNKSFYLRERLEVIVESEEGSESNSANTTLSAYVYVLPPDKIPPNAQIIPEGDWKTQLKNNPPICDRLTDKQKNYVLKLGSSSSREIVPIDMGLYRELMSFELIVDKGRRLALSQLGLELYRHLR